MDHSDDPQNAENENPDFYLRMTPELKADLREAAWRRRMSMAGYLKMALEEMLESDKNRKITP